MPSHKRLSSVCHSVAHHAASSLSYLHPHLGQVTEETGSTSIEVDLVSPQSLPAETRVSEPLKLASAALQSRFKEMLKAEGFAADDLQVGRLFFEFQPDFRDYWPVRVGAALRSASSRTYIHAVNQVGEPVSPRSEWAEAWSVSR